jgi:hypothetical protein
MFLNSRISFVNEVANGFLFFVQLENVNALQTLDSVSKFKMDLVQLVSRVYLVLNFRLFIKTQSNFSFIN